jgi:hypothetical protein
MAFDSVSNITLPKPTVVFYVNNWVLSIPISKPTISIVANNWTLSAMIPVITFTSILETKYTINSVLPKITLVSSFNPDNLYHLDKTLKKPNIIFSVTSPNLYTLTKTLSKPKFNITLSSDMVGVINYKLPTISLVFNTDLSATTAKQVWVFNTVTTAHSRYTNYDFDSFFKIGSTHYGINDNGNIYTLTGSKDFVGEEEETEIDAEIVFPIASYDEQALKSCSDAIIYGRADGYIEVQVILDEQQSRTGYIAYFDDRPGIHRRRIKIPKGLQGNVWQWKIKNVDGSWFNINMFEIFVKTLQRVIKGR